MGHRVGSSRERSALRSSARLTPRFANAIALWRCEATRSSRILALAGVEVDRYRPERSRLHKNASLCGIDENRTDEG